MRVHILRKFNPNPIHVIILFVTLEFWFNIKFQNLFLLPSLRQDVIMGCFPISGSAPEVNYQPK